MRLSGSASEEVVGCSGKGTRDVYKSLKKENKAENRDKREWGGRKKSWKEW